MLWPGISVGGGDVDRTGEVSVRAGTVDPETEPVVTVRGLVKRYGRREAVRGIDLDVHRGEVFAPRAQRCREDHDGGDPGGLP